MHPFLFSIGPLTVGSYGVLLAVAFISAFLLINHQFKKNSLDVDLAWDLHFFAIFGGIIGSRLLYIFENFSDFLLNPWGMIFSSSGFSVLGGYTLAILLCVVKVVSAKLPLFKIADVYVPGMALGYAIGRLGCIAAGDGCYGLPTKVPWAMSFPNGIVSTLSAKNPSLAQTYVRLFPNEAVPVDIQVHPTPLYESISSAILLFILLKCHWKIGTGSRFAFFLIWFSLSRFLVEFIRLNPIVFFNMSSGQLFSVAFFISGIVLMLRAKKQTRQ